MYEKRSMKMKIEIKYKMSQNVKWVIVIDAHKYFLSFVSLKKNYNISMELHHNHPPPDQYLPQYHPMLTNSYYDYSSYL